MMKNESIIKMKKVSIRKLLMLIISSFSIFSLLFSAAWNCPCSFLKLPYNFTSFPLRLITHTIDKSCIFLICNGILVFLAKTSGLIKGSTTFRSRIKNNKDQLINASPPADQPLLPFNMQLTTTTLRSSGSETLAVQEEEGRANFMADEEEQEKELMIGESVKFNDGTVELNKEEEEDADADDDVWNTPMSTDELNKKFDEFIRKMKEEIKVEDQQNLVVVK